MNTLEEPSFEEEHESLLKLATNPAIDPTSIPTLNLSNSNYRSVPPSLTLIHFSNLRIINFSHNRIERFLAESLVLGAPLLEELDFSHNNIQVLDDIVELGALQHLNVLTFLDNPITGRYLRIKMVELLLFPEKYQARDPVRDLTATYNIGMAKPQAEQWQILCNRNILQGKSKSVSPEKKERRNPKGIFGSDLVKVSEVKCPVPRKTRFPGMTVLNGEMISVNDLQSILTTQDLGKILPGTDVVKKVVKPVRFEKLHGKYIESYVKRKERKKEDMNQVPTMKRIASIIGEESDLKLIYYADHMRYGMRKIAKQDYEEQLWKMRGGGEEITVESGGSAGSGEDGEEEEEDFEEERKMRRMSSGITMKGKSDKEEKIGKKEVVMEKKRGEKAGNRKEKPSVMKKWLRKETENDEVELEVSKSSDSNLSERNSPVRKKNKSRNKEESISIELEREEIDVVEMERTRNDGTEESLGDETLMQTTMKSDHRSRSVSVPKWSREGKLGKRVGFGENSKDEKDEVGSSHEIRLFNCKRANSMISVRTEGSSENQNLNLKSFRDFIPLPRTIKKESGGESKEKTARKFVVMKNSTPNMSLTYGLRSKSALRFRKSSMQSDIDGNENKQTERGESKVVDKKKAAIENSIGSSKDNKSKSPPKETRILTEPSSTDYSKTNRGERSNRRSSLQNSNSVTDSDQRALTSENQSTIHKKEHLYLRKVPEGQGFESIDELRELEQTVPIPTSSLSKASFLTPIKKFSRKTSFQQQSVGGDISSVTTFPGLSPTMLDKSPSKELQELEKDIELGVETVRNQGEEAIAQTNINALKYSTLETQRTKMSPTKMEKFYSGKVDGKEYLKLLVAKKKAQKVKDHDQEAKKLSQVIFLNRSNSAAFANRPNKKGNGILQQQQSLCPPLQGTVTQQKPVENLGSNRAPGIQGIQENQVLFQKLFSQLVSQQKAFYSKTGGGQKSDRPSFYFAKAQSGYNGGMSSRLVISKSQQEQSTDLRSPEKTRMRTEEDGVQNSSYAMSMSAKMTNSFLSRQVTGQVKMKTARSAERKEVVQSYGESWRIGKKMERR